MPDIIANNLHGRPLNTLTEVLISSWLPPPSTDITTFLCNRCRITKYTPCMKKNIKVKLRYTFNS